jgi:hypothetical protein
MRSILNTYTLRSPTSKNCNFSANGNYIRNSMRAARIIWIATLWEVVSPKAWLLVHTKVYMYLKVTLSQRVQPSIIYCIHTCESLKCLKQKNCFTNSVTFRYTFLIHNIPEHVPVHPLWSLQRNLICTQRSSFLHTKILFSSYKFSPILS